MCFTLLAERRIRLADDELHVQKVDFTSTRLRTHLVGASVVGHRVQSLHILTMCVNGAPLPQRSRNSAPSVSLTSSSCSCFHLTAIRDHGQPPHCERNKFQAPPLSLIVHDRTHSRNWILEPYIPILRRRTWPQLLTTMASPLGGWFISLRHFSFPSSFACDMVS